MKVALFCRILLAQIMDGVNDFFTAKSTNLASFNCQLINRWGVLVAELSEPNQSWNGTTKSGVALPEGVYYYVVSAKGKDDKEYNLKGFVSLVRWGWIENWELGIVD